MCACIVPYARVLAFGTRSAACVWPWLAGMHMLYVLHSVCACVRAFTELVACFLPWLCRCVCVRAHAMFFCRLSGGCPGEPSWHSG